LAKNYNKLSNKGTQCHVNTVNLWDTRLIMIVKLLLVVLVL